MTNLTGLENIDSSKKAPKVFVGSSDETFIPVNPNQVVLPTTHAIKRYPKVEIPTVLTTVDVPVINMLYDDTTLLEPEFEVIILPDGTVSTTQPTGGGGGGEGGSGEGGGGGGSGGPQYPPTTPPTFPQTPGVHTTTIAGKKYYFVIGPVPLRVAFKDTTTNHPTSWLWDFGDGNTSTDQNPVHIYSTPGIYNVTLSATNANGYTAVSKVYKVIATVPAPVADFTSDKVTGDPLLVVQFTDASTNNPTNWSWDFGDGSTSTLQHPSHTYSQYGYFTVSLTATNSTGFNTVSKYRYISVLGALPGPSFTGSPLSSLPPLTVTFTDSSTNGAIEWIWYFGDGTTSTEKNPIHTYTVSGKYTVTLTVSNINGSSTLAKEFYVDVLHPYVLFVSETANSTFIAENGKIIILEGQ